MCIWSNRAICTFKYYLAIELMAVVLMDTLFHCTWSKNITLFEYYSIIRIFFTAFKILDRTCLCNMFKEAMNVYSFSVVDRAIVFIDADNFSSMIMPEFGKVGTNITESLYDNAFTFDTFIETMLLEIVWIVKYIPS